jgi:hypothetical protein
VTRKRMPSQREQYGDTVHLFIGTGRSPCKITSSPFAFDNNSIVIYLGLDSLFLFKSVSSFSAIMPKLPCEQLRLCSILRILSVFLHTVGSSSKIPVHTLYSKDIVKSCF